MEPRKVTVASPEPDYISISTNLIRLKLEIGRGKKTLNYCQLERNST